MFIKRSSKLILLIVGLCCWSPILAQKKSEKGLNLKSRFISSAGLSYSLISQYDDNERLYGVNFCPSLNLLNAYSDFSIAITSNLGASVHPQTTSDDRRYSILSFPLILQTNIGHLATQNFYSSLGIFFGVGSGFCIVNGDYDHGTLLTTGLRFWFLKHSFTIRYERTQFKITDEVLHQVSLQVNIGRYLKKVRDNNKISNFVKPFQK